MSQFITVGSEIKLDPSKQNRSGKKPKYRVKEIRTWWLGDQFSKLSLKQCCQTWRNSAKLATFKTGWRDKRGGGEPPQNGYFLAWIGDATKNRDFGAFWGIFVPILRVFNTKIEKFSCLTAQKLVSSSHFWYYKRVLKWRKNGEFSHYLIWRILKFFIWQHCIKNS